MTRKFLAPLAALLFVACASNPAPPPSAIRAAATLPPPPATEVRPVTETIQGVEITDPYRWLEDQESPETRAWIEKQNAYTDSILGGLSDKQRFAERIKALLN